jgi:hypothetical protein
MGARPKHENGVVMGTVDPVHEIVDFASRERATQKRLQGQWTYPHHILLGSIKLSTPSLHNQSRSVNLSLVLHRHHVGTRGRGGQLQQERRSDGLPISHLPT